MTQKEYTHVPTYTHTHLLMVQLKMWPELSGPSATDMNERNPRIQHIASKLHITHRNTTQKTSPPTVGKAGNKREALISM